MPTFQDFAKGQNSGNAQNGQPARSGRTNATDLKAPVPKTTLSRQDHLQQPNTSRRQSGSQNHHSVPQQQPQQPQPQQQLQGQSRLKRNAYDTDADSIDTTAHQPSVVQIEDSQQHAQQYGQELGGENEDDNSDDQSDDEEDEDFDDEDLQIIHQYSFQDRHPVEQQQQQRQDQGMFAGGGSYPSTTSGPPSNFPQGYNEDENRTFSEGYDDQHVSPSPKQEVKGQPPRHIAHRQIPHPAPASETNQTMRNQELIYQRAADIRSNQRTSNGVPVHGGVSNPPHNPPLPSSQSTIPVPLFPPVKGNTRQIPRTHPDQNLQRSTRQPSGPTRSMQVKHSQQQPVPKQHAALAQRVEETLPPLQSTEVTDPVPEPAPEAPIYRQPMERVPTHQQYVNDAHNHEEPLVDYDIPELFEMKYDQLKNEKFDADPRGRVQVLSEDIRQKPLEERLEHVRKHLDPTDQFKFFQSLPTLEWENSGDWFLDKFSDIIKRMKEARQAKRKYAIAFENEIEQRHEGVEKRKHLVDDAMDQMKTQGTGLIPKSPTPNRRMKSLKKET